jgi:hypothetical protein
VDHFRGGTPVRGAQSWWDLFDNQDDFLGFGYRIFTADQIKAAANVGNPINIVINIRSERILNHQNQQFKLIDDYDVFGHFIASIPKRPTPGSLNWPEYEGYDKAVKDFTSTKSEIDVLRGTLAKAGDSADPEMVRKLNKLKKETLPRVKKEFIARFPAEWTGRDQRCR